MSDRQDFESGAGTYLKVVRFPDPTNPDGYVVAQPVSSCFAGTGADTSAPRQPGAGRRRARKYDLRVVVGLRPMPHWAKKRSGLSGSFQLLNQTIRHAWLRSATSADGAF